MRKKTRGENYLRANIRTYDSCLRRGHVHAIRKMVVIQIVMRHLCQLIVCSQRGSIYSQSKSFELTRSNRGQEDIDQKCTRCQRTSTYGANFNVRVKFSSYATISDRTIWSNSCRLYPTQTHSRRLRSLHSRAIATTFARPRPP